MRVLVIADVQNDFCEGGSLAVAGGAAVARAISEYLDGPDGARYDHVVATQDFHIDPGSHFSAHPDYLDSWPPHCVADSPGAQFHPNLRTGRIEAVFRKGQYAPAYSGFEGRTEAGETLAHWLAARGVSELDVAGIATDYCVRTTAADALKAGFATSVLLQLTAGVAAPTTASAIDSLGAAGATLIGRPLGPAVEGG